MFDYDVCVIGGGILGCMAARNLTKYDLRVMLAEQREDVCTGITRANSAIIYAGYDHKPDTKKASFCVQGNKNFGKLCEELGVRFHRCGSLMVCFGPEGKKRIEKKYENGRLKGVEGIRMLTREEVLEMEPSLSPNVYAGLYAPTTGTVLPWELGMAAAENAAQNGCDIRLRTKVEAIRRIDGGYEVQLSKSADSDETTANQSRRIDGGYEVQLQKCADVDAAAAHQGQRMDAGTRYCIRTRAIMNCAGLSAAAVRGMLSEAPVQIRPTGADYYVYEKSGSHTISHVIFYEPEEKSKGLTLIPTVEGKLLAGATERELEEPFGTSREGLAALKELCETVVPDLRKLEVLRNFAAVRPNPYDTLKESSIASFVIDRPEEYPGLLSLIGIKTPGLTCCDELTKHCAKLLVEELREKLWEDGIAQGCESRQESKISQGELAIAYPLRKDFNPLRKPMLRMAELTREEKQALIAKDPDYGVEICHCEHISLGEIKEAIRRGAVSVSGVKYRCGAGMGKCQGTRCMLSVVEALRRSWT